MSHLRFVFIEFSCDKLTQSFDDKRGSCRNPHLSLFFLLLPTRRLCAKKIIERKRKKN